MSIEQMIELTNEMDREAFFENYIAKQNNIKYIEGFRKGIMERSDIYITEKLYYCGLVNDRLNILKGGKK